VVLPHSLDDRIRELCAKVVAATDGDFREAMSELRSALHEHTQQLRKKVVQQLGREKRQ
jgi:Cdc6-like AAA superfamily ATPase